MSTPGLHGPLFLVKTARADTLRLRESRDLTPQHLYHGGRTAVVRSSTRHLWASDADQERSVSRERSLLPYVAWRKRPSTICAMRSNLLMATVACSVSMRVSVYRPRRKSSMAP